MRLITMQFGKSPIYIRCLKVLEHTVKLNSPNTPLEVVRVDLDIIEAQALNRRPGIVGHDVNNAFKTREHERIVKEAQDGEILCLIDVDTFVTGDISTVTEVLPTDFDIAITRKPKDDERAPINTGVIFVRVSDKTRKWFERWREQAFALLGNSKKLRQIKKTHLGINQSSLSLLRAEAHDLKIELLPCAIWNSTTSSWEKFSEETKIVHVLGQLRMTIFNRGHSHKGYVHKLAKIWRTYEKEARGITDDSSSQKKAKVPSRVTVAKARMAARRAKRAGNDPQQV